MRIRYIFLITSVLMFMSSCGSLDKLIRSRDFEAMYKEGLNLYQKKKDSKAIMLLTAVEPIFEGRDNIDTIKFYIAKAHYRQTDYVTSSELFDNFRKTYNRSAFAEEAEYLYAMSNYEVAPNPELDQTYTVKAITSFNEFIENNPNSPRVDASKEMITELQERIYDKEFFVGNVYYNIGYYNSAIHAFKLVLKQYPDIPQREKMLYLIVKASYEYAKKSVSHKQRERFYNTLDAYYNFVSEFPKSKYIEEVERIFRNAQKMSKGEDMNEEKDDSKRDKEKDSNKVKSEIETEVKTENKEPMKETEPGGDIKEVKKKVDKKIQKQSPVKEIETDKVVEDKSKKDDVKSKAPSAEKDKK